MQVKQRFKKIQTTVTSKAVVPMRIRRRLHAKKSQLKQGIYLLPNMFTTAALFFGVYAVAAGMQHQFDQAAIAVLISAVLDGLDGKVARLTKTNTAFGAQYDSLSDMVSFGVAPALIALSYTVETCGNFSWVSAFIYVAATGLRLARFNVQQVEGNKHFIGLASPASAIIVSTLVWVSNNSLLDSLLIGPLTIAVVFTAGLLMISGFRYRSFKEINFVGTVPFMNIVLVVAMLALVALNPSMVLLLLFSSYALSAPLYTAYKYFKKRIRQSEATPVHESEEHS